MSVIKAFLFAFILIAPSLQAQLDLDVSVSLGGALTSVSSTFRPLPGIPAPSDTLTFRGQNSGMLSVYSAVGFDVKLFDVGISQWRVGARGSVYGYTPEYDASEVIPIARNGEVYRATLGHRLSTPIQVVNLEPYVRVEFWKRIGIDVGFPFTLPLSASYTQTQRFIDPAGTTFIDGSVEQLTARGDVGGMKQFAYGLDVRAEVLFPISTLGTAVVFGTGSTALQSTHDVADWRPVTFGGGVGVRLKLLGGATPAVDLIQPVRSDTTRDTVVVLSTVVEMPRTELVLRTIDSTKRNDTLFYNVVEQYRTLTRKPPALLRVSVKVGFEQPDGSVSEDARLLSTRTELTRSVPLLPVVMFDSGTSTIPLRYKMLKQRDAQRWSEQRLASDTSAHWQYHVLNVIGSRMRRATASTVEVLAYDDGSPSGTQQARSRAEIVQQYLVDVFRIPIQRLPVIVSTSPLPTPPDTGTQVVTPAAFTQPWVYLRDRSALVSGPINMHDTITESQLPLVRIIPEIVSEAGLASWSVQMQHRGRTLRTFSENTPAPSVISWDMREDITMDAVLVAPVVVDVTAVDVEGTSVRGEPGRISLQGNAITDASARLGFREEVLIVQALDNLRTPDADMLPVPGEFRRMVAQREGGWFRQGLIEPELGLYRSTALYINEERRP
ncbi:MAG: hypothetical protein SGJ05_07520 [bacterium]|nr:hypothetical protein [bacterium]